MNFCRAYTKKMKVGKVFPMAGKTIRNKIQPTHPETLPKRLGGKRIFGMPGGTEAGTRGTMHHASWSKRRHEFCSLACFFDAHKKML